MTLVAACRFRDGAVILADSRATWLRAGVTEDTLQKVLYVGPRTALAFAGSVAVAACVTDALRKRGTLGAKKSNLYKIAQDLPRVAKRCYSRCTQKRAATDCGLGLVFVGVDNTGNVSLWYLDSPQFKLSKLDHGSVALGSGAEVVTPYLTANFNSIDGMPDLKSRAAALMGAMESELRKAGVGSVGGLFQVITVASDGIRTMDYGFTSLDPESPARSLSMRMVSGKWVQTVEESGTEVPLAEPTAFARRKPSKVVVQDFSPVPADQQQGKWFLSYFVPCLRHTRSETGIEFSGLFTSLMSSAYPTEMQVLIAAGFWGSPGSGDFVVKLEHDGRTTEVHRESITVERPIEIKDVVAEVRFVVSAPGPSFLECHFDDQLLGRKAFYLGTLPPGADLKNPEAIQEASRNTEAKRKECSDPYLKDHAVALAYWTICEEAKAQPQLLSFAREPQAVYWKQYPLVLRTILAAGFRTRAGSHGLRVDLVHAQSRIVTTVTTARVESESDMSLVQVPSEVILPIPRAGWYFVNLYCDDELIGSTMLCAEQSKAVFSYSLRPGDIARVEAGELLMVLRRAKSYAEVNQT